MSNMKVYIVCWLLLVISIYCVECCGPAEIGQQFIITSTANVQIRYEVVWQIGNEVVLYDSSLPDPNNYPNFYVGTRTQLTIKNVTKNDETLPFIQFVDSMNVYNCTLPVYKRPSTPICEAVTLIGNLLRTNCITAQVFPQAKCMFTLQNGGTDTKDISDGTSYITYTHTDPQPGGNEYYSSSCTLQYPVDGLKPGNWRVQVSMYPDLTGVSLAQGTTGQADNRLQLSVPTVNINPNSTDCPKGLDGEGDMNVKNNYIREGKQASCLCTRAHAGNPPGTISWSSTHAGNFGLLYQTEDTATIQINLPDVFTCQSTSLLDGSPHSMTYTPSYAYGPNEVTVSLADNQLREVPNKPLNLCGYEGLDLIVICAVKQSDVRPGLTFNDFKLNKPNAITTLETYLDSFEGGVYKSVNKLKINSGGSHTLVCEARNSIFEDITQTRTMTIEARKPPSTTPVVSAWSRQNGDVLVYGDDVIIKCLVYGGYPSVQSVTLNCGQDHSVTSDGTSTELTLHKIKPGNNSINCACQASHVTGCYDMTGVLPLNILSVNPNKAEEDASPFTMTELVGTAIGSIVGTLVLVAAIALIVFFIRREKGKRSNRTEDKDYDKIRRQTPIPYQNVKPRDSTYQEMDSSDQAPNSASAIQETERTYRNQAFGEYEEPVEPDANAYSDIQVE